MKRQGLSRRAFVRRSAAVAAALTFPTIAPRGVVGRSAPSGRLQLAMFGVGTRGDTVMRDFARHDDVRFVAVCDPFKDRREKAKAFLERSGEAGHESNSKGMVETYADYRDVMTRKDIDAIVCCSCDHWHVPLAFAAARAEKDMYVEKPLGPCLAWSKRLRDLVRRRGRVFQYGTQQRSDGRFRYVAEIVRNGYLGKISHVDAWCIDGTRATDWFDPKSTVPEPVPDNIDYDLWLGPAPLKPYNHYRVHREGSFHTYDYSIGFLGGWGAHPLDIAQWGLDTDDTSPVEYKGVGKVPTTGGLFSTVYDWSVRCRYSSGVTLDFMSDRPARPVVDRYRKRWSDHGTTFFGSEGWISVDRGGIEASDPCLLNVTLKPKDVRLPRSKGHERNFLDCVRTRAVTLSPLEAAIRSDTISHLSDIAIRTGRTIRWDPLLERIVGDEEADRRLTRPMRAPYQLRSV